jgi:hypothetical protein
MNILMICEYDPAGRAIEFCKAINAYSKHSCRLITTKRQYGAEYEEDMYIPSNTIDKRKDYAKYAVSGADIIHFHVLANENMDFVFDLKDYIKGKKKIIHHHHGHQDLRISPKKYNEHYKKNGRTVLVSTPDLLKLIDNSIWMPNILPLSTDPLLQPVYDDVLPQNKIIVCQAIADKPQIRGINWKDTNMLRRVVKEINDSKIELRILEGLPYKKCLEEKRKAHITFDHMQGYFGVSSLESLAQGKPVIAGIDEWNRDHLFALGDMTYLPWSIAQTQTQLYSDLIFFANDTDWRKQTGELSRQWMEKYWNEQSIVDKLVEIYEQ